MKKLIKQNPIICFILFAYGFSWACWLSVHSNIQADIFSSPPATIALLILGGWGPSIAAILVTIVIKGGAGTKALLKKYLMWRTGFRWYLAALFAIPLIRAICVGLFLARGGEIDYVNYMVFAFYPVILGASIIFGPLAEELGWRGFVLPKLYKRYGFTLAAIGVGLIATFWHTPLFWASAGTTISGETVSVSNIMLYALYVVGTSFIYTWVFKNTNGSVLMAILTHLSINGSGTAMGFMFPNLEKADIQLLWYLEIFVTWIVIIAAGLAARAFSNSANGTQSIS